MAGELKEQLQKSAQNILASILADERVGQMTAEEIAAVAGMRLVSEDALIPSRRYAPICMTSFWQHPPVRAKQAVA